MRVRIAAALTTTAVSTGMLLGAPAVSAHAAGYPVSTFDVTYGNTYTRGTITWYSRSVAVEGTHKSVKVSGVNDCRGTTAFTLDSNNKQLGMDSSYQNACGGWGGPFNSFTVPANVAGGAAVVRICLNTWDDTGTYPVYLLCKRYGRPLA